MKEFYHICMTAHSEVLLRSPDDVALFTNLSAYSAYHTDSEMLADSEMSTHLHQSLLTENPKRFAWISGISLTRAFNFRHGRKGKLFDGKPFIIKLSGTRHMQMGLNYILRQGLHHGQSETAFDYPWSTCNHIFSKERGVDQETAMYRTRPEVRDFLHKNADFPDTWQADSNGILLRRSFEQLALVENWYGTPRSFIYSMVRKTSEEWLAEQNKDDVDCQPVSLGLMEKGYGTEDIAAMLQNENNTKFYNRGMSDMDLCMLIDKQMLGRFRVDTVYALTSPQKQIIANELRHDLGIKSEKQISRCLVMNYGL